MLYLFASGSRTVDGKPALRTDKAKAFVLPLTAVIPIVMFEICDPLEVRDYGKLKLIMLDEYSFECIEKISDHVVEYGFDFQAFVKEGKEIIIGSANGPYDLVIPYNMEIREMLKEVHKITAKDPKSIDGLYYGLGVNFDKLSRVLPPDVVAKVFALNMYFKLNKDYFKNAMKNE